MKIRRILIITLVLLLAFSTVAFGLAERKNIRKNKSRNLATSDDVLLSDFMTDKKALKNWTVTTDGESTVGYAKTEGPDGKTQQALLVSDKVPGTSNKGARLTYTFPTAVTKGTVEVECRFKMEVPNNSETKFASNGFYVTTTDNKWANRLYVAGNLTGGDLKVSGAGRVIDTFIDEGVWYTAYIQIDIDKESCNIRVDSDSIANGTIAFSGLKYYETGSNQMAGFTFESRMFTADWYFDYIRISRDGVFETKVQRPTPLAVPKSGAPVQRAAYDEANVMINGEYVYFTDEPVLKDGEVYVPVMGALNLFGYRITVKNDKYIGNFGENTLEISADGTVFKINKLDSDGVTVLGDAVYVSVNDIAHSLGETAVWNGESKTLTIGEGVTSK